MASDTEDQILSVFDDFVNSSENHGEAAQYVADEIEDQIQQSHPVPFRMEDLHYDMSGKKMLIILNHNEYIPTAYYRPKLPGRRIGTQHDVRTLKDTFDPLGFHILTYNDYKRNDIFELFHRISNEDHCRTSCLAIAILTHGGPRDQLYAADRPYYLKDITNYLEQGHPSLVNKPKLFFIQACRGDKVDDGRIVEIDDDDDAGDTTITVPTHSDFLCLQSTIEGQRSWSYSQCSWMIQEMYEVIKNYSADLDLLHLMTLVIRNVAYGYTTNTKDSETHEMKQTPEMTFTVTKLCSLNNLPDATPQVEDPELATDAEDLPVLDGEVREPRLHTPTFHMENTYYDMMGEKIMIIFNHYKYKPVPYYGNKLPAQRDWNAEDVRVMKYLFGMLGFRVYACGDYDRDKILGLVKKISKKNHINTSCLGIILMTHGEREGVLKAADQPYLFEQITNLLKDCHPSLVNKLKLLFVQSCRGQSVDVGRTVQLGDPENTTVTVPTNSNFLYLYSTVEDYVSWRNSNGSWMIQEFCNVVREHHRDLDLLNLITIAGRNVAHRYESVTPPQKDTHLKKQTVEARTTLTKLVQFNVQSR